MIEPPKIDRAMDSGTIYINPTNLWRPPIFSQAIVAPKNGRKLYLPLQVSRDEEGHVVGRDNAPKQIDQAFENLRRLLATVGLKPRHILRLTHFFVDYEEAHLDALFRNLRQTFAAEAMPTSTGVCVNGFGQDGLLYAIQAEGILSEGETPLRPKES